MVYIYECPACGNTAKTEIKLTYPPHCLKDKKSGKPHLTEKIMKLK